MSRISQTFTELKDRGQKALIPYIMAGDPTLGATKRFLSELDSAGADIIEIGVPFSDPLADGPTIQKAAERALGQGVTLTRVLKMVSEIRNRIKAPLVLMTYYNPVFKFGLETFAKKASEAGVDGVIVPDLIPDEADDFISLAKRYRLDTIFLLAPTSTKDRINKVVNASTGFIYYVSITGITGAKLSVDKTMKKTLNLIKKTTRKPTVVGFGISNHKEASNVAALADGVVVGSALVRLISEGRSIKALVKKIKGAI
jgi:tryptophan synthase alpha chain